MVKKTEEPNIYCLYHEAWTRAKPGEKTCWCIKPADTPEQLKIRLENQIQIYRILYKHVPEARQRELVVEADKLKARLAEIQCPNI